MQGSDCEPTGWGGGGLVLASLKPVFQLVDLRNVYVDHWIPGMSYHEASFPVKVPGMKLDLSSLFYLTVHISCSLHM